MLVDVYETTWKVEGFPGINTGHFKIQMTKIYGGFFQRHIWEMEVGGWSYEKWIKAPITKLENWNRTIASYKKSQLMLTMKILRSNIMSKSLKEILETPEYGFTESQVNFILTMVNASLDIGKLPIDSFSKAIEAVTGSSPEILTKLIKEIEEYRDELINK